MIENIIFKGFRFKIQKLENDFLVTMYKQNQVVDKFISPFNDEKLFFVIENFLNKFYSVALLNTTMNIGKR